LRDAIDALGGLGVIVVAAAGNNATVRDLLPAGFSSYLDGVLTPGESPVPLVSVGALNPDGSIALFSNGGRRIACHSPGASLVSTLPVIDVSQRPGIETEAGAAADREVADRRATIDPDSFAGFGIWSGTSFAAPLTAGALAQALLDGGLPRVADDQVRRSLRALAALQLAKP
jgi:subtilisin family serine protease